MMIEERRELREVARRREAERRAERAAKRNARMAEALVASLNKVRVERYGRAAAVVAGFLIEWMNPAPIAFYAS